MFTSQGRRTVQVAAGVFLITAGLLGVPGPAAALEPYPAAPYFALPLESYGDPADDGCLDWGGIYSSRFPNSKHVADDVCDAVGTPVLAAGHGKVVLAGTWGDCWNYTSWGPLIVIEHRLTDDSTVLTIYGHTVASVAAEEIVYTGQVIGTVGDCPTSPHLHFGIRNGAYGGTIGVLWDAIKGYLPNSVFPGSYLDPYTFVTDRPPVPADWACAPIASLVTAGILVGPTCESYVHQKAWSRADVATAVGRALGIPTLTGCSNPYEDVTESDYFFSGVVALSHLTYGDGKPPFRGDSRFRPAFPLTRSRILKVLFEAWNVEPVETTAPFDDRAVIEQGLEPYMASAVDLGLVSFDAEHRKFRGNDFVTMAEGAVLIDAFIEAFGRPTPTVDDFDCDAQVGTCADDECTVLGATSCFDGTYVEYCGDWDQDGCLEKRALPCDPGSTCVAGTCRIPVVEATQALGESCTLDGECLSGQCRIQDMGGDWLGGMCVTDCGAGCPEGTVCADWGEEQHCVTACQDGTGCRDEYACLPAQAGSGCVPAAPEGTEPENSGDGCGCSSSRDAAEGMLLLLLLALVWGARRLRSRAGLVGVSFIILLGAIPGCKEAAGGDPTPAAGACTVSMDCDDARLECRSGWCRLVDTATACSGPGGCAGTSVCLDDRCRDACQDQSDCEPREMCDGGGCIPLDQMITEPPTGGSAIVNPCVFDDTIEITWAMDPSAPVQVGSVSYTGSTAFPTAMTAIRHAVQLWHSPGCVELREVGPGETPDIWIGFYHLLTCQAGGAVGCASITPSCELLEGFLGPMNATVEILDKPFSPEGLIPIVSHEVGHVLGLGHVNGNCDNGVSPCPDGSIMCCSVQDGATALGALDRDILGRILGCTTSSPCGTGGPVCTPGTRQCTAAGNVEACATDGCQWDLSATCGEAGCAAGACASCTPQTSFSCVGADVYWFDSCGDQGGVKEDCGVSQDTGSPYCASGDVYQDHIERGCTGDACFSDSSAVLEQTCALECSDGQCVDCLPGATESQGCASPGMYCPPGSETRTCPSGTWTAWGVCQVSATDLRYYGDGDIWCDAVLCLTCGPSGGNTTVPCTVTKNGGAAFDNDIDLTVHNPSTGDSVLYGCLPAAGETEVTLQVAPTDFGASFGDTISIRAEVFSPCSGGGTYNSGLANISQCRL